jgi:formylglycine-generating enzyme required for sulfatase activity
MPNAWGLFDMHGNVWRWCSDGYGPYSGDAVDPKGADNTGHVIRGGSWKDNSGSCRSAARDWSGAGVRGINIGFRICLDF